MPAGGGGAAISVRAFTGKARGFASGVRRSVSQVSAGEAPSLAFVLHAPGRCQALPESSGSGLLQMSVWRADGSLSGVFAGFCTPNEALSGIVFAILIVTIAAVVISTERTERLARFPTVLAAGLSHELRTPLASLGVAADDLKSGHVEDQKQARRYGEIMATELRRLGDIVDQALALTRLTQSNRPAFLRSVSVSEIVSVAMDALAPRLNDAQIKVEMQIAQNVPNILADPDLVLCSLTNLLENAIRYAGSGRWVRVSAEPERHSGRLGVEMTVEDRGPGISADEAAAVFEPFYRGAAARHCRETGSGLGLAIAKSAVLANGGWIKLERAVPQGCRFRLFFLADHSDGAVPGESAERG
jgi:two-component system, OmpR family, sensor histidine kinase SenX3